MMDNLDRYFKAYRILNEYVENNLFCTNLNYRLKNKIAISKWLPIYLKNPNEFELEILREQNIKRMKSFFSIFPTLSEFIKMNEYNVPDKYCYFTYDIIRFKQIYNIYVKKNDDKYIKKAIKENNISNFVAYLCSFINDTMIVVEVENYDVIDNYLKKYFYCNDSDINNNNYRHNFINGYINLFNIVNFDYRVSNGIQIDNRFGTNDIERFRFDNSFRSSYIEVYRSPILIDEFVTEEENLLDLMYLVFNIEQDIFIIDRVKSINLITCLEFLMLTKLSKETDREDNLSLEAQFARKIKRCLSCFNYQIDRNELIDIYNYRSCIVHGNFNSIPKVVSKINNYSTFKKFKERINQGVIADKPDSDDNDSFIYARIYEIFNYIYRLYCINPTLLKQLKSIITKNEFLKFKIEEDLSNIEMRFIY